MNTIHWTLALAVALLGESCMDTVNSSGTAGLGDDTLLGDDGWVTIVDNDLVGNQPQDTQKPTNAQPWLCAADKDCQAVANACNLATCVKNVCHFKVLATDAPCDDGDPCTVNTTCHGGACVGNYVCYNVQKFAPLFPAPPSPEHHSP